MSTASASSKQMLGARTRTNKGSHHVSADLLQITDMLRHALSDGDYREETGRIFLTSVVQLYAICTHVEQWDAC